LRYDRLDTMTYASALLAIMALSACTSHASGPAARGSDPRSSRLTGKYCVVEHDADAASDAKLVDEAAADALDAMNAEFSDVAPQLLPPGSLACTIHVLSSPMPGVATEVSALARTPNDGRTIDVYLLAPSAMPAGARTMLGEPKDELYTRKVVAHELSTLGLERVTQWKKAGWYFHTAPAWFEQGMEEYLGRTFAHAGVSRSIAVVTDDPSQIYAGDVLHVKNPYLGGTVLVAFLYDEMGQSAVHRLLMSEQPTFEGAWREAIGLSDTQFAARVRVWLARPR
jgi:hypothetical protein